MKKYNPALEMTGYSGGIKNSYLKFIEIQRSVKPEGINPFFEAFYTEIMQKESRDNFVTPEETKESLEYQIGLSRGEINGITNYYNKLHLFIAEKVAQLNKKVTQLNKQMAIESDYYSGIYYTIKQQQSIEIIKKFELEVL